MVRDRVWSGTSRLITTFGQEGNDDGGRSGFYGVVVEPRKEANRRADGRAVVDRVCGS